MSLKEEIERLRESSVFKEFKKEHPDAYLAHAFVMLEKGNRSEWQLGYYIPEKDRIVTFFMREEIKRSPPSKIFKESKKALTPLDMGKVKHSFAKAFEAAIEFQKERFPAEKPAKVLSILQANTKGAFYHITFITNQLNTLTIVINSETLEVAEHKLNSILDFASKK